MALVKRDNFKSDIPKPNACCETQTTANKKKDCKQIARKVINLIKDLQNDSYLKAHFT